MKQHKKMKLGIGGIFGLAAFIVILGCVSILTILFYHNSKSVFKDNFGDKLVLTGDVVHSELNTVYKEEFVNTDFLTKNYAIAAYVSGGSEGFKAETLSTVKTYNNTTEYVMNVALFDKNGQFLLDSNDGSVEDLDGDLAKRLYTEAGILTNKQVTEEGHTLAWYYQPIINEYGTTGGFVGKQIDETILYSFLKDENLENSATASILLIDQENRILISKDDALNGQQFEQASILDKIEGLRNSDNGESYDVLTEARDSVSNAKRLLYIRYFPEWDMSTIISIDEAEIMAPINDMVQQSVLVALIMLVVALAITFVITRYMTKPIHRISELLIKTKALNFQDNSKYESLRKNKTELGMIAVAVFDMIDVLKDVTGQLAEYSQQIHVEAESMEGSITKISEGSLNNSASTQQLSASMDQMSASAQEVSATTVEVTEIVNEVDRVTTDTQTLSREILEENNAHNRTFKEAKEKVEAIYEKIKADIGSSMEQSQQSLEQITSFTDIINGVADQTNLLSLNASIEAARAGESGKGFHVIAQEVNKLAGETLESSNHIASTITRIHNQMELLFGSIRQLLTFMEEDVVNDYVKIDDVTRKQVERATQINALLTTINDQMDVTSRTISNISVTMDDTSASISDSASGVRDIADSVSQTTGELKTLEAAISQNKAISDGLAQIINQFKL